MLQAAGVRIVLRVLMLIAGVINRAGRLTYPMMAIMGVGPMYVTLRRA